MTINPLLTPGTRVQIDVDVTEPLKWSGDYVVQWAVLRSMGERGVVYDTRRCGESWQHRVHMSDGRITPWISALDLDEVQP